MILDNYFKAMNGALSPSNYSRTSETIYDIAGSHIEVNVSSGYGSLMRAMKEKIATLNGNGDFCLVIGTDNTPVTKQDYLWSHDITGLTDSGGTAGCADRDCNRVIRVTRSYANNTSEDIEVKEVGLILRTYSENVLIVREVLPEPVVVKANGGIQAFGIDLF